MYIGARVEMKDGSIQGTITAIPAPNFWSILWDDGESGAVHPFDVKFLGGYKELEYPGHKEKRRLRMKQKQKADRIQRDALRKRG